MEKQETLDIIALVKNHPLNKLSNDDNGLLVNKIKERFTNEDQQLFVANFYCYLNYDTRKDYVVELDKIWKWIGFSQKVRAKELLVNNFTENKDYVIENNTFSREKVLQTPGRPEEIIKLTVHCFKKLCLKAKTKKSDEIHEYYVNLEEVVNELAVEQAEELKNQLLIKDKQVKEINEKLEKNLLENFSKKTIFYVGYTEKNIIKCGWSDDGETRIKDHKKYIRPDFTFEYIYESQYAREIERKIFKHQLLVTRRISKVYNGKNQTELFQLDTKFTLKDFIKIIQEIKKEVESKETNKDKDSEINQLKLKIAELEQNNNLDKLTEVKTKVIKDIEVKYDIKESKTYYDESIDNVKYYVVRNIKTSEEKLFSNMNKVGQYLNYDPRSVYRYIDSPNLVYGNHIRSFGKEYWQPCDNFVISETNIPYNLAKCIKLVDIDTGIIKIYESISEASRIFNDESIRRNLSRYLDKNKVFIIGDSKVLLTSLISRECGTFIKCPNKFDTLDNKPIKELIKELIVKKKKEQPIILRNIETKEKIEFKSKAHAKTFLNYDMTNFIDKARHIKGYTINYSDSEKYWVPPKNFKFVKDHDTKNHSLFIKTTNSKTNEITYYNSVMEMALIIGMCKIDDISRIKENARETINNLAKGRNKYSKNTALIDLKLEELEFCGHWIYSDSHIEEI